MTKTALYRHFDADGVLLYVGISVSAGTRTSQHRRRSAWFEDVARIELQWYPTRSAAEVAEWQAIKSEKPLHNKAFIKKTLGDGDAIGVLLEDGSVLFEGKRSSRKPLMTRTEYALLRQERVLERGKSAYLAPPSSK